MLVYLQIPFLWFLLDSFLLGAVLGGLSNIMRVIGGAFGATELGTEVGEKIRSREYPGIGKTGRHTRGRCRSVLLFFGDFLFVILFAFGILTVSFFDNNGKIRAVSLGATFFGFWLWRKSLGRVFESVSDAALAAVGVAFEYMLLPFRRLYGAVCQLTARTVEKQKIRRTEKRIAEASRRVLGEIEINSCGGFIFSADGGTENEIGKKVRVKRKHGRKNGYGGFVRFRSAAFGKAGNGHKQKP